MSASAQRPIGRWGTPLTAGGPTWLRAAVIIGVLAVAFVVAQTCQRSQIRLTKDEAIVKAKAQVDFTPRRTQIRFLRQGLGSEPFWIVSLSRPGRQPGSFSELAVVRIDANTGRVKDVRLPR